METLLPCMCRVTVLDSLSCIVRSWIQDVSIKKVVATCAIESNF